MMKFKYCLFKFLGMAFTLLLIFSNPLYANDVIPQIKIDTNISLQENKLSVRAVENTNEPVGISQKIKFFFSGIIEDFRSFIEDNHINDK